MKNIYHYDDPTHYLIEYFHHEKQKNSNFTVKTWAEKMNLNSALLAMILKGKRSIRSGWADSILSGLDLDFSQHLYFKVLVLKKAARNPFEANTLDLVLKNLSPGRDKDQKFTTNDSIFEHWATMGVFSAAKIKNIPSDEKALAEMFIHKLEPETIKNGIRLLEEEGLVLKESNTLKPTISNVAGKNGVPLEGAKRYYRQVLDLAKDAVDLPVEKRDFQGFSLALRPEDLDTARGLILDLRKKLDDLESENATQVFQANIQLFPLTREMN